MFATNSGENSSSLNGLESEMVNTPHTQKKVQSSDICICARNRHVYWPETFQYQSHSN